jgi:hypothetical protein
MRLQLLREYIRELLQEGVYDPSILKAVFMAGGPGSGKTHTAKLTFGADPKSVMATMTASGLKIISSDIGFEHLLRKAGVDPSTLRDMPEAEWLKHTEGPESERGLSKLTRNEQKRLAASGRVGVIMDGTGDKYEKMAKKKAELEAAGYDTHMLFINTSLDIAQQRNKDRPRSLKPAKVEEIWHAVQDNMGAFQRLFGRNDFAIIDNTVYGPLAPEVSEAVDEWLAQPIKNPIGRRWIETELAYKEHEFGKEDIEKLAPGVAQRTLGHGGRAPGRPGAGVRGVSSTHEPISDAEIESMRRAQKIKGI